jgi:tRNA uridine 5-carboxymethylaminomethyl modification enzyme
MAGINAASNTFKKNQFVLERSEAYIGVLIDDLTNTRNNRTIPNVYKQSRAQTPFVTKQRRTKTSRKSI